MELPIEIRPKYLLVPGMMLEDVPVDQAVAFLLGICAHAGMDLSIGAIHGDEPISLNTNFRTVAECLNLLADMTFSFWKIWPNGMFYFLEQPME